MAYWARFYALRFRFYKFRAGLYMKVRQGERVVYIYIYIRHHSLFISGVSHSLRFVTPFSGTLTF